MIRQRGYTYQAGILCNECGEEVCDDLECPGDSDDMYSYDSENYPKPILGTLESDHPEHCDHCEKFLKNELTERGREYVYESVIEQLAKHGELDEPVQAWSDYYGIAPETGEKCHDELDFLDGPFQLSCCGGHVKIDSSYLNRSGGLISCPYCDEDDVLVL